MIVVALTYVAWWGKYVPGVFRFPGLTWETVLFRSYYGGDGMFGHALNPIPTNFTDQGVLPMLQESFLFWRISKGAPGLPEEAGPWDSAMPAWENFLTEEEMWDVVLFLYDFNDYRPRARVEHH